MRERSGPSYGAALAFLGLICNNRANPNVSTNYREVAMVKPGQRVIADGRAGVVLAITDGKVLVMHTDWPGSTFDREYPIENVQVIGPLPIKVY